jgi:hypothetical protein
MTFISRYSASLPKSYLKAYPTSQSRKEYVNRAWEIAQKRLLAPFDSQASSLSTLFRELKPEGAFVYISTGNHTSPFTDVKSIRNRPAYAVDPYSPQYYSDNGKTAQKVRRTIEANPNHKLLKMTAQEAVKQLADKQIGIVYMLNAYANVSDVLPILQKDGYLVCNSWTKNSGEALNNTSLKLIGIIRQDNPQTIEKTNTHEYFEEVDSLEAFKKLDGLPEKIENLKKVFSLTENDDELISKYYSLVELCERKDLTEDKLNLFLQETFNYEGNSFLESGYLFVGGGSKLLQVSFTKKSCDSNDLFVFQKS